MGCQPIFTVIIHIKDGFDFLGYNFGKYKGKLLIKPSRKSIESITDKIRKMGTKARAWAQDALIKTLNPIIRGWANYYRHIVATEISGNWIITPRTVTWQWGKHRHPDKGHRWIVSRYWKPE